MYKQFEFSSFASKLDRQMQSGRQQVMSSRRMAVSHGGSVVQWVRPDTAFFQSLVLHKTCSSNCICTAVKSENAEPFASTEA